MKQVTRTLGIAAWAAAAFGTKNTALAFSSTISSSRPSTGVPAWMRPTRPLSTTSLASTTLPSVDVGEMPLQGDNGMYEIIDKEQHLAFLKKHEDKLVVLKFYAPWCRACKALAPRFVMISQDEKYKGLPMVWAQMSVQHNKDYIKSLGVLALPSVHIYAGGAGGLVENFPCGPSKVPILKRKLAETINDRINPTTKQLQLPPSTPEGDDGESTPCAERSINTAGSFIVGDIEIKEEQLTQMKQDIPYFKDLTPDEFDGLLAKAKLATFEQGSIILRQGMEGNKFYIIMNGEVELSVRTGVEDPLTTPSGYLGTSINRLKPYNFFGERSLITGQPRAASVRAINKTRCLTFDKDDIPASSVLSGKKSASDERMDQVNDKYAYESYDIDFIKDQYRKASLANQERGSFNKPHQIRGVDTDEEITESDFVSSSSRTSSSSSSTTSGTGVTDDLSSVISVNADDELIIPLLVRFKLIRHAARCFDYIMESKLDLGDDGEVRRRSLLVSKLTPSQRQEFSDVYSIIDENGDGLISLLELKRVMESIGEVKSDEQLRAIIQLADPTVKSSSSMGFTEFMGVMAEAEFYHLFRDTFKAIDKQDSGYLKARDLDRVLCGMRDLISDDRKSIIDVEDEDMLIDYEQFSKMLLGTI